MSKHKPITYIEDALQYAITRKQARANKRIREQLAKRKVEHMFNNRRNRLR